MKERWIPGNGEGYWCILDTNPIQTKWCGSQYDIARWETGNVFKTHDQALIASINIKSLLLSSHYNETSTANSETLKDTFTEHLKKFAEQQANKILQKARERRLSEQYHNGPEETKLPDWCRQGEWIYTSSELYLKINGISIDLQKIELSNGATWSKQDIIDETVPARLRPWNFEEAPFAVKCRHSITAIEYQVAKLNSAGDGYAVKDCCCDVTLQGMANYYEQMDGSPCGVLEHLENGEWVK